MTPQPPRPELLRQQRDGAVLHLRLNRPAKRNAVNDGLIDCLERAFTALPEQVRCVVLSGEGEHFCAGLDLSELAERTVYEGVLHSRMWHAALERIQYAPVPVVAVLHGAVVGGGLEIAAAAHLRVAEPAPSTACPKASAGSSSAAAARCASRA